MRTAAYALGIWAMEIVCKRWDISYKDLTDGQQIGVVVLFVGLILCVIQDIKELLP